MTFGQRIKLRRKELGLTLVALASCIGCSDALVANLESGEKQPTPERIEQLADALGLDADELSLLAGHLSRGVAETIGRSPRIRLAMIRAVDGDTLMRLAGAGSHDAPHPHIQVPGCQARIAPDGSR